MKTIYYVTENNEGIFEGTIEQYDDTFGIAIDCSEEDVLAHAESMNWKVEKFYNVPNDYYHNIKFYNDTGYYVGADLYNKNVDKFK
jgi:hypothetical protein